MIIIETDNKNKLFVWTYITDLISQYKETFHNFCSIQNRVLNT